MINFRKLLGFFVLVGVMVIFSFNACKKAEEESIKPGIELKQFEPTGVSEASMVLTINNSFSTECEYGYLLISIDSADVEEYYEKSVEALNLLNTVDLYLSDQNLLKKRLSVKILGKIGAGEVITEKEIAIDSLSRNNGYVVRAFLRSEKNLAYSKALGIKSLDTTVLELVTSLTLPFNPVFFHFRNDIAYFIGDTQTYQPSLFSYQIGSSTFQTLSSAPFGNEEFPFSTVSFMDGNGEINYLVQKPGTLNKKPYNRATYNIASNAWTTQGNTCVPSDTTEHFTKFSYFVKTKLITSLTRSDEFNKLNRSNNNDYCPEQASQNIAFNSSCEDYSSYSTRVKNSFAFKDTIYLTLNISPNKLYYFDFPTGNSNASCLLYTDLSTSTGRINGSFIFRHFGSFYSLNEETNPVSGNSAQKDLFLYKFTEQSTVKPAYNISNSATGYVSILKGGICRGFTYKAPYTYLFVVNPATPGKVHVFKFKP